jgi:hypothetical protein
MTAAAQLLDAIVPIVRTRLPRGVDVDYLDDFLARNRFALEAVIEQNLGPLLSRMQAANRPFAPDEDIPELWSASKRTAANIAAMTTAAKLYAERRLPNAEERAVLAGYSGWGGLSIQAASGKFPAGFPVPEERGLIQHRHTPIGTADSHAKRQLELSNSSTAPAVVSTARPSRRRFRNEGRGRPRGATARLQAPGQGEAPDTSASRTNIHARIAVHGSCVRPSTSPGMGACPASTPGRRSRLPRGRARWPGVIFGMHALSPRRAARYRPVRRHCLPLALRGGRA